MSVFEEVPRSFFKGSNVSLVNGTVLTQDFGYVGIENVTNTTVTIRYLFYVGHKFAMYGLPQTVVNMTNDTMLIRFDLEENKTYYITDPRTRIATATLVTQVDNSTITLDENPPLVGKDLHFEVTVRSIVRPS
jgi:hypothetical protein